MKRTISQITYLTLGLALATPAAFAKDPATKSLPQTFRELFRGWEGADLAPLQERWEKAPRTVRSAIRENYGTHDRRDYFKISPDGHTAVTYTPGKSGLESGTTTLVHSGDDEAYTHSMRVVGIKQRSPILAEILDDHAGVQKMVPDGKYGFPLSRETNEAGLRHQDYVASVPVKLHYTNLNGTASYHAEVSKRYAALKNGDDNLRFTVHTELDTRPLGQEHTMEVGADGVKRIKEYAQASVFAEASVFRPTPESPITKLEGKFKGRTQKEPIPFEFEIHPRTDGKPRQILDVKFSDSPRADRQTMQVTTTDGYMLTYKVEVVDGKVKFKLDDFDFVDKNIWKQYQVEVKKIHGRRAADADGAGAKGLEAADAAE